MGNENKKIIIGIVSKHGYIDENSIRTDSYIRDEIKQSIYDNGAIAIGIISPNEEILFSGDNWLDYVDKIDTENIITQIDICDGIILQGGINNEAYESFISKYCYEKDIPCLGICAGQNSIARGIGGTVYKIPNPNKHDKSFDEYVHSIKIDENSKFYNIVKTNKMMVNSRHKRAIKSCPMLNKVAFCEDGYPDVIEAKNRKFYIGVRFHPESLYKKDENMNNIFKSFIEACKNK